MPAEALPLTEPQDRSLSTPLGPTCLSTSDGICQRPPSAKNPYSASNEDFNNSCSTPPTLPPAPPLYATSRCPAKNNWGRLGCQAQHSQEGRASAQMPSGKLE